MKILYFMNHVERGGAALALYDLIVELKNKYEIEMVVFTGKKNRLNDMLSALGIENYVAPYRSFMCTAYSPRIIWKILYRIRHDICLPFAIHKIERLIDVSDYDIIHTNLNRVDIGAILAHKYHKPHLWHIREHGIGDFELISVVDDFASYMESYESYYVAISNSVKNRWKQIGLSEDRIDLIYDGVRTDALKPDSLSHQGKVRIVFLGGYCNGKGQEFFLDAISQLSAAYLDLIKVDFYGNGEKKVKRKLNKKVKQHELEKVVSINDYCANIYDTLGEYDIGINCSKNEGFGRVTVEYMLAGLCPIATIGGANTELIRNGETGYLVENGNIAMLCSTLVRLIESREEICKCAQSAREYAKENFSMTKHANKIYEKYVQILNNKEVIQQKMSNSIVKVSVIVPVFNVEEYVLRCLNSLKRQTISNIEVIIIDDGSTDRSGQICDEFCKEDPRFRVIHQENKGLSGARNTGLDEAIGEYIIFVDSDDYVDDQALVTLTKKMDTYSLECISYGAIVEYEGARSSLHPQCRTADRDKVMRGWDYCSRYVPLSTAVLYMFQTKFLKKKQLRFTEGIFYEDMKFTPEALLVCSRFMVCNFELYYYMQRAGSIMRSKVTMRKYEDICNITVYFAKLYKNGNTKDRKALRRLLPTYLLGCEEIYYKLCPSDRKKADADRKRLYHVCASSAKMTGVKGTFVCMMPGLVYKARNVKDKVFDCFKRIQL